MVATSLVLVLSTPARATRHVGRFHQLVDLHVDRRHRSGLRRFHQPSVELRDGIGDRYEGRCINGEILRQLLPQKVRRTFTNGGGKRIWEILFLFENLLQKDKQHGAPTVAARRAYSDSEQQEEQRAERQRGELHMRRVPIRDLHRRDDQRPSKGDTSRVVWDELDAETQFLRVQRADQESVDEVSAHGGRGERYPRLGRLVAAPLAIQARLPHGHTQQLERPVERMLRDARMGPPLTWSDNERMDTLRTFSTRKFWIGPVSGTGTLRFLIEYLFDHVTESNRVRVSSEKLKELSRVSDWPRHE